MVTQPRGRKPTDAFWVEWIRSKVVNEPGVSINALARAAEEEAEKQGRTDSPSARTIQRIREKVRKTPDEEQREYRLVYWPETFERGDLPWEAASYVLEFMRITAGRLRPQDYRPDVRRARWYWRISLAIPDSPPQFRGYLAAQLTMSGEQAQGQFRVYLRDGERWYAPAGEAARREVENYLLYRPEGPQANAEPMPSWAEGIGRIIPREMETKEEPPDA